LGVLYESAADPDPIPTLFNEISLTPRRQAQISHPGFGRSFERVPTLGRGGHERQPRWKAPHGKRSGQVACFQALRGFPEGDQESRIGFLEELAGALGESVEEGGRGLLGTLRAVGGAGPESRSGRAPELPSPRGLLQLGPRSGRPAQRREPGSVRERSSIHGIRWQAPTPWDLRPIPRGRHRAG
jgi:hypothetical protein